MLADFHVHSNYSDGELSISQLVDLYGQRGFGAIAITDHICEDESWIGRAAHWFQRTLTVETFPEYLDEIRLQGERALRQYGMVVLPGFELSQNFMDGDLSAHIVAIGCDKFIPPTGTVTQMVNSIHGQGGLAIAAHPVSTRKWEKQTRHLWNNRDSYAALFDAWEVASGPWMFEEVLDSGLPMVASSDLHTPAQIHSWKTVLNCAAHPEAILAAVREQRVSFRFFEESVPLAPNVDSRRARGTKHPFHDLIESSLRTADLAT